MNNADNSIIKNYIHDVGQDIYCDLIIPKKILVEMIYESETVIAFIHTNPLYQYHFIVTPKIHVEDIMDKIFDGVRDEIFSAIQKIITRFDYQNIGAKIETNVGSFQKSKHLHFHVFGGKKLKIDPNI
ncbi:HIT domain-containing protein [Candidatus Uhrbacteria bacterium]|nr:HIT domain-containing protein [Candidatus Uhrbacteria bacterium]